MMGTGRTVRSEVELDIPPALAYELLSSPQHLTRWWCEAAELDARVGGSGVLTLRSRATNRAISVELNVIEASPARRLSVHWGPPAGQPARPDNSVRLTFDLVPTDGATRVIVTEDGMNKLGWNVDAIEEYCRTHHDGWSHHLSSLKSYAEGVDWCPPSLTRRPQCQLQASAVE